MSPRFVILVVEDEPLVSMALADDLEHAGFDVLEAPNADEAVKLLECRDDISLVVTDIDMPGSMNGLKLAAAVADRWTPVRVIIVSGHHDAAGSEIPSGSVFYAKPYRSSDIVSSMHRMLARPRP